MGRADLQLHSDLGDGLSSIEEILDSAERAGLDVIALTDHDDIRGAFALRELAARRSSPVEVVPGVEVTTRSGHLLALWIEDEVPMFCSLAQALSRNLPFDSRRIDLVVLTHPQADHLSGLLTGRAYFA